ncbi:hypothetical protein MRB53_035377 [Persea americana]|uniref:Uncharacterized protein n=1 Tax=Persea americana TaxID=3435 RepID=A0ACC2K4J1_PERAE|nr:hypothetical protein MRB53_035377 [Persea americana]
MEEEYKYLNRNNAGGVSIRSFDVGGLHSLSARYDWNIVVMDKVELDAHKCEDAFILDSSSSLGGPPGCAIANAE